MMIEIKELIIQNEKALKNANRSDDAKESITIGQ